MTWRRYLQVQTRNPAFLWRMVIAILAVGVVAGMVVDYVVPAWIGPAAAAEQRDSEPLPAEDRVDLDALARESRWRDLWLAIPGDMARSWRGPGATALAALTGLSWLAFALQAIQFRSRRDPRLWLPPVAVALGVLSIWPTVFLIYWQEQAWNLVEADDLAGGVRYYVLGVGLREELAKFVCYLPLLPIIVRRRDPLAALVVPGCVGIGFAMEENVAYIAGSVGVDTLGRLLSAAPVHLALTSLVGLAAYRACVWPRQCGPHLAAVFGVAVLAHGLYDSFIAVPDLAGDYNIVAGVIFILLVYQFFRELRPAQQVRAEPISLSANFLFCVSTVAAATFIYLSAAVGLKTAADVLAVGVLSQAVMVYLFLREMPETMVSV